MRAPQRLNENFPNDDFCFPGKNKAEIKISLRKFLSPNNNNAGKSFPSEKLSLVVVSLLTRPTRRLICFVKENFHLLSENERIQKTPNAKAELRMATEA